MTLTHEQLETAFRRLLVAVTHLAEAVAMNGRSEVGLARGDVCLVAKMVEAIDYPPVPPPPPPEPPEVTPPDRRVPMYVCSRDPRGDSGLYAGGVRAGFVFHPPDKQAMRQYGAAFDEVDWETKPFHLLTFITCRMVEPEDYNRLVASMP